MRVWKKPGEDGDVARSQASAASSASLVQPLRRSGEPSATNGEFQDAFPEPLEREETNEALLSPRLPDSQKTRPPLGGRMLGEGQRERRLEEGIGIDGGARELFPFGRDRLGVPPIEQGGDRAPRPLGVGAWRERRKVRR